MSKKYRVWGWMIDTEVTESGWVSDLIHRDYSEAEREMEEFQDTQPDKEFEIREVE